MCMCSDDFTTRWLMGTFKNEMCIYYFCQGGISALSPLVFFYHCSFHCCCVCVACDSSIVATCTSIHLSVLLFACVWFVLFLLFVVGFSGEPKQN